VASYGKTVVDRKPANDLDREAPAANWNDLRADAAYLAQTCPLLVVRVTNNGATASVASYAPSLVATPAAIRLGAGSVQVDMPAGVTVTSASVSVHGTTVMGSAIELVSATRVVVRTTADAGFELQVR
jgi:hypothetical protein